MRTCFQFYGRRYVGDPGLTPERGGRVRGHDLLKYLNHPETVKKKIYWIVFLRSLFKVKWCFDLFLRHINRIIAWNYYWNILAS